MNEATDSIVKMLESGRYFRDARNWYIAKYVSPLIERSMMFFFSVLGITGFIITIGYFLTINDAPVSIDYLSNVDKIDDDFSKIEEIYPNLSPQMGVEKFMVETYVATREAYDYNKIVEQGNFIKNNSSLDVYKDFASYISLDNSDGPLVLYKDNAKFDINIISSEFKGKSKILVKFQKILNTNLKVSGNINQNFIAMVDYTISDLNKLLSEKRQKLDFKVTAYEVKLVE